MKKEKCIHIGILGCFALIALSGCGVAGKKIDLLAQRIEALEKQEKALAIQAEELQTAKSQLEKENEAGDQASGQLVQALKVVEGELASIQKQLGAERKEVATVQRQLRMREVFGSLVDKRWEFIEQNSEGVYVSQLDTLTRQIARLTDDVSNLRDRLEKVPAAGADVSEIVKAQERITLLQESTPKLLAAIHSFAEAYSELEATVGEETPAEQFEAHFKQLEVRQRELLNRVAYHLGTARKLEKQVSWGLLKAKAESTETLRETLRKIQEIPSELKPLTQILR